MRPLASTPKYTRKLDARTVTLACEELRAIEPEGFDADEDPICLGLRYRTVFEL